MRRCVECHNILNLNEAIACDTCKKAILDQLEEEWQDGEIVVPPVEPKIDTKKKQENAKEELTAHSVGIVDI